MTDVNYKSVLDSIQQNVDSQRYRPKQLIFIVRKRLEPTPLTAKQQAMFNRFKDLIELRVMSTELVATEGRRNTPDRNFHKDTIDCYSQDFKFAERIDKLIYNEFREMRAADVLKLAGAEILIIEPNHDLTKAVDAWLFQDMEMSRIRNAHTPRRDLAKALEQDPEGKDVENFTTTLTLYGKLCHWFSLMEQATRELNRMNLVALNPNEHPAFLGGHSVAADTPAQ